ncbi:MAG: deoxyribodipyrimidine photo-lyase, partial [Paraburkholderia sp.]
MTRVRRLYTEFDAGLVWFRRDLRSTDQAALYYALKHCRQVWCAFVFDTTILEPIRDTWRARRPDQAPEDRRIEFIRAALEELDQALRQSGGGLIVLHDDARNAIPVLAAQLGVDAVFTNHDYEPAALERDEAVRAQLAEKDRELLTFKDQVIFERDEILTGQGKSFTVFTTYKNA